MYYSRIYVDPKDVNRVYIMGSNRGVFISDDGARNFREVFSEVHGEDHVLWIDPESPNHMVVGGDGGVSISYDRGETWLFRINLPHRASFTIFPRTIAIRLWFAADYRTTEAGARPPRPT